MSRWCSIPPMVWKPLARLPKEHAKVRPAYNGVLLRVRARASLLLLPQISLSAGTIAFVPWAVVRTHTFALESEENRAVALLLCEPQTTPERDVSQKPEQQQPVRPALRPAQHYKGGSG